MWGSFFRRVFVPHALLFVGLGARDLTMPYEAAQYRTRPVKVENEKNKYAEEVERERQEQLAENRRRIVTELSLVAGRGVTGFGGIALAWAITLTLCGAFRSLRARNQTDAKPGDGLAWLVFLCVLCCVFLGMCIGSASWWVVGLVDLAALLVASPWLFLLFQARVVPEMADEWRRRDEARKRMRADRARRGMMLRQIAQVETDMGKLRASELDPDMIEDEVLRLQQRKRELESELELFDARGE